MDDAGFDIDKVANDVLRAAGAAGGFEQMEFGRTRLSSFAADVLAGLSAPQKYIPSQYLWDEIGSALFEAITCLREYKCTRAELRILARCAGEIKELAQTTPLVVELGGGNGAKAARLLAAWQNADGPVQFHNIDISRAAIEQSSLTLAALSHVKFCGHVCDLHAGYWQAAAARQKEQKMLVLFLGSSIGNYDRAQALAFLQMIRQGMRAGDLLLLGTDLVKPLEQLKAAYDDPQGVTAAFNKNILARINYELGANFNLKRFRHRVRWHSSQRRLEMHLVSSADQLVTIAAARARVAFRRGESIHTENSHKYLPDEIGAWLAPIGLRLSRQWIDREALFATNLLVAD
jgi:dimethylhistidine N-methyltransferase